MAVRVVGAQREPQRVFFRAWPHVHIEVTEQIPLRRDEPMEAIREVMLHTVVEDNEPRKRRARDHLLRVVGHDVLIDRRANLRARIEHDLAQRNPLHLSTSTTSKTNRRSSGCPATPRRPESPRPGRASSAAAGCGAWTRSTSATPRHPPRG